MWGRPASASAPTAAMLNCLQPGVLDSYQRPGEFLAVGGKTMPGFDALCVQRLDADRQASIGLFDEMFSSGMDSGDVVR